MEIAALGVPCGSGSCSEVYLEKAFPGDMRPRERLHNAKFLGESSLMFQVHPTLKSHHIDRACEVISVVMRRATQS
jgi:dTDP-4-amino-4,6-dideoxygalactose transaminase